MKKIILLIICIQIFSCKRKEVFVVSDTISVVIPKHSKTLNDEEIRNWQYKDIFEDTIPGISLDKAYTSFLKDKKGEDVIVAVIDTEVDINHEDLKEQIWINSKEIPNNSLDDDNNGYIDDIHGWNFLGNQKGENVIHTSYEFVRLIKKFKPLFENKSINDINTNEKEDFETYKKALEAFEETKKSNQNYLERLNRFLKEHNKAKEVLNPYFSFDSISKKQLLEFKTKDTILEKHLKTLISHKDRGITEKLLLNSITEIEGLVNSSTSLNYQERKIIGDNPEDITDTAYGNNNVSGNLDKLYHGTLVSGVIVATRNNNIGIDGILNEAKIMSLCVSANGGELDKDIALAIRYAVDNGAKIINMSSGKHFSMNRDWVNQAIKYAAKKDVLFITSAGNDKLNLDENHNNYYPNDIDGDQEISDNFMMIGASSYTLDKRLRLYLTNYGKKNVDLFAPGYKVYTTLPNNKYRYSPGTSIATALVSGIAALIRSHYPNLKASEVKEILMSSGISYNIDVEMFLEDGSKKMIPFSQLSKSGKIVNAYNALLLAEQVSKGKN